jgi:hypothetical protein
MWRRVDLVWTDVSEERIASIFSVSSHLITLVPRSRIFLPWRWRRHVPPKHRFNSKDLHGATSKKTALLIDLLLTLCVSALSESRIIDYMRNNSCKVERILILRSVYSWLLWDTISHCFHNVECQKLCSSLLNLCLICKLGSSSVTVSGYPCDLNPFQYIIVISAQNSIT